MANIRSTLLIPLFSVIMVIRDELSKNRSFRKIDSQRLFSREYDFPKTFSLTENQFSRKSYFYTIDPRLRIYLLEERHGLLPKAGRSAEDGDNVFRQTSSFKSMTVAYSDADGHPTLYVVLGRAKPVLRGPNSTEPNLFLGGETTYRVG